MKDTSPSDTLSSTPPTSTAGTTTRSKNHDKHVVPWRFPTSICTDGGSNRATDPVQSWASTSKALSQFYSSLQQLKSLSRHSKDRLSTSSTSSSSALSSALASYNLLSQLQSTHDTILVPRRDTRTLFLIQGREPKTSENLEQLLMIAMDLIWLNEKDRQKRRALVALRGGKAGVTEVGQGSGPVGQSISADTNVRNSTGHGIHEALDRQQRVSRYEHKRADDYHGLRVSEYTVLMNWIGSVSNVSESGGHSSKDTSMYTSASSLSESTKSKHGQRTHQHSDSPVEGPVGRAWAIWQDFLLTGMKPDVVLYTVLMDKFLKAKEFARAKQIWEHMHVQDDPDHPHDNDYDNDKTVSWGIMSSIEASDPVSKTLNSSSVDRKSQPKVKQRSRGPRVVPNVQTFSVLMQTHVLNRDLQGVAQTYGELLQTAGVPHVGLKPTSHNSLQPCQGVQQLGANTVLLNQVLRVLIDLGEVKAAKGIYAEMKSEGDSDDHRAVIARTGRDNNEQRSGGEDYTSDTVSQSPRASAPAASTLPRKSSFSSTPLHHQAFMRRSEWTRGARRKNESSAAPAVHGSSLSIRPDETTHILMLDLARRQGDHELQDIILRDLDS
ncbi:hypothetical protein BGZ58_009719 [Dissophora ornata]|nr:hypothetical protein BGZ58_009719 [Dissophora ornata]